MASSGVLYMKGMNGMVSGNDTEEAEDVWDDSKLTGAYNTAMNMAGFPLAKRLAMSTNSGDRKKEKSGERQNKQPKNPKANKKSKQSRAQEVLKESVPSWKEGMACRAVYSVDGFEYEAVLLTILDDDTCVIRFLGYNNTEIVPLGILQPSLGKQARQDQMLEALGTKEEDTCSTQSVGEDFYEEPYARDSPSFSKKRTSRNKRAELANNLPMPNLPMPDISAMMREFGQMDMPMPPPPPLGLHGASNDEEAVSNMLISWYMTGYYTGLYQGMRRLKQRHRDC